MKIHQIFFFIFLFFIIGIVLSSISLPFYFSIILSFVSFFVFLFLFLYKEDKKFLILSFLVFIVIFGVFYGQEYNEIKFGKCDEDCFARESFSGRIISQPEKFYSSQSFLLKSEEGNIFQVKSRSLDELFYGDYVDLRGGVKPLNDKNKYIMKYGAIGTIDYPEVVRTEKNESFSIKKITYQIRDKFVESINKILPKDEAALMNGILLGNESAGFSSEFKEKMKNSGTTHLVALSGYNISILIVAIFFVLGAFLPRNATFAVSIAVIFLFVIMTGAQASIVRAAIMGSMVLLAQRFSRVYDFFHSVTATVFFMFLLNPNLLVYDLGFILSFLSLFGLAYLSPYFNEKVNFANTTLNFLKNIFFETLSAQIMVIPILAMYFGSVSLVSLISNVIILPLIPLTMFLGFVAGVAGILFVPLAKLASFILMPFLLFETKVIEFFGSMKTIGVNFGWVIAVFYYLMLLYFIIRFRNRTREYF